MKRDSYELLDDGFLNLYEEGIFVRSFEYTYFQKASAIFRKLVR